MAQNILSPFFVFVFVFMLHKQLGDGWERVFLVKTEEGPCRELEQEKWPTICSSVVGKTVILVPGVASVSTVFIPQCVTLCVRLPLQTGGATVCDPQRELRTLEQP